MSEGAVPTNSLVMAQVGPDGAVDLPDAAMRVIAMSGSIGGGREWVAP